ncbi:MAG: extracellular solute-binding protein, partial [Fimbriimonadaceae bacterium]|nr:extracellular solute-binding protein [Fimbriimonadaceae bacterium]
KPNGAPERWGYVPGWQGLWTDTMLYSLGLNIVDDPKDPKVVRLAEPEVMRVFQYSADLALKDRLMPSGLEISSVMQSNARKLFTEGKVSMFHSGIWETVELRKELQPGEPGFFEWDIVRSPAYADGRYGTPTGGSGYSIISQTKHPREAWLLTQWMAGPPGMSAMARAGIAQPAIAAEAVKEPWIPGPNTSREQMYPANRIITHESVPYVVFGPSAPYWDEINRIIQQPYSLVYDGTSTVEKEFPRVAKLAQDRLEYLRAQQTLPAFNWGIGTAVGLLLFASLVYWVYSPELKIRRTMKQARESRTAYAFIAPWLIGTLAFTVGPMLLSLLMSFADWDIVSPAKWRGLGNYQEAFFIDPTFWPSIRATVLYTFISVPLGVIAALALALLLNTKVMGMPLWRTCYYIPSIASAVAAALIWRQVFKPEGGLLNLLIFGPDLAWAKNPIALALQPLTTAPGQINWLGSEQTALASLIIMSLWGAGAGMIIILAGLQGVPGHYYEAATLDGAGKWRQLLNVTLPLISPTLFFTLITGFIGSFQVFASAFLITQGGPNNATMFLMLHVYNNAFVSLRMGYASGLAWVLFFITLIFTAVQLAARRWVYYEGAR